MSIFSKLNGNEIHIFKLHLFYNVIDKAEKIDVPIYNPSFHALAEEAKLAN